MSAELANLPQLQNNLLKKTLKVVLIHFLWDQKCVLTIFCLKRIASTFFTVDVQTIQLQVCSIYISNIILF